MSLTPTTTVYSEKRENLRVLHPLNPVSFKKGLSLRLVLQPSLRVMGSRDFVIVPQTRDSLVKWLTMTMVPPGRQTRRISAIMRTGSGTTDTTWNAIT